MKTAQRSIMSLPSQQDERQRQETLTEVNGPAMPGYAKLQQKKRPSLNNTEGESDPQKWSSDLFKHIETHTHTNVTLRASLSRSTCLSCPSLPSTHVNAQW